MTLARISSDDHYPGHIIPSAVELSQLLMDLVQDP